MGRLINRAKQMIGQIATYEEIVSDSVVSAFVRDTNVNMIEKQREILTDAESRSILGFTGVKVCSGCHLKEYVEWRISKHSRAYLDLQNHDDVQFDNPFTNNPQCLVSHTTCYCEFASNKRSITVYGVSCEQCHGAGGKHVEMHLLLKNADRIGIEPQIDMSNSYFNRIPTEEECSKCHDSAHSLEYEYDLYLSQITHKVKGR